MKQANLATLLAVLLTSHLLIVGCSAPGGTASPQIETLARSHSNEDPAELARGRAYFLRECGACHRRYRPGERSPEQWRTILAGKSAKVSLNTAQFNKLKRYVLAAGRFAADK